MTDNLVRPSQVLRLGLALFAVVVVAAGCSGTSPSVSDAADQVQATSSTSTIASTSTAAPVVASSTTTSILTTTTTVVEYAVAGLRESVSFVDSCVSGGGTSGACQCALGAAAEAVPADQWAVFEDRLIADLGFSDELAAAIEACRGAAAPPIGDLMSVRLDAACVGVPGVTSECSCAVAMAQEVVPASLLEEWAASVAGEVEPAMADLVARCT